MSCSGQLKKTWNMSKNIDDKEGKQLVFGGNKARGDWVAVKIPGLIRHFNVIMVFGPFEKFPKKETSILVPRSSRRQLGKGKAGIFCISSSYHFPQ